MNLDMFILSHLKKAQQALCLREYWDVVSEISVLGKIDPAYGVLLSNTEEQLVLMLRWQIACVVNRIHIEKGH
jgi:hypothetical protein